MCRIGAERAAHARWTGSSTGRRKTFCTFRTNRHEACALLTLPRFGPKTRGTRRPVSVGPSPFRVVVIDDSAPFRELLIDYLEGEESFAVVGKADDGVAAEALIDLTDPDVVILDVHLPRVSGLEVLERARERHAETLFVVNSSDDATQAEAVRLGADVYVDKATPFDEICDAIVRAEDDPPSS